MGQDKSGTKTTSASREKTSLPPLYKVILWNDDYTTMEFVIEILQQVFRKSASESNYIMLQIHHKGSGVCGTYPFEVAETKASLVRELARQAGYPLRASLEEA